MASTLDELSASHDVWTACVVSDAWRSDSRELELGPEAIVLNVYVEPAWRRRGVADALMRAVLDGLAGRGIRRIVLHASDDGRRLYERLGFMPTNEMRLGRG